jgi:hypothetical protein
VEEDLTADDITEYMALCAGGCALAAASLVHVRQRETLQDNSARSGASIIWRQTDSTGYQNGDSSVVKGKARFNCANIPRRAAPANACKVLVSYFFRSVIYGRCV